MSARDPLRGLSDARSAAEGERDARDPLPSFDAVVLAGGRGRRLGGVDKAAVVLREARLVDRVLAAARGAGAIRSIAVGPDHAGENADVVVREDPPFTGPLPALAAGLAAVEEAWVLLLPCDLERPAELCALLLREFAALDAARGDAIGDGAAGRDGVRLLDENGRPQWLAGVYRASALREGLALLRGEFEDLPLRLAFARAEVREVVARQRTIADIDTPADLERANLSTIDQDPGGPR